MEKLQDKIRTAILLNFDLDPEDEDINECVADIIKAVKERDDFIIGSIPAIITVERYLSGNPKIINNRRLIIRLKEQTKRAKDCR